MRISVNLKWVPVNEVDVAGYKIYTANTVSPHDAGRFLVTLPKEATSLLVSWNARRKATFFYVTAFDIAGNESPKRLLTTVFVAG